jgi:multidrug resistance efflux pump
VKKMHKKKMLPVVLLLALIPAAVYFLFFHNRPALRSLDAAIYGELLEIQARSSGPVKFIAAEGQKVLQHALLLEIDSSGLEQARLEAEQFIQEQISALPPASLKILQGYALIPEGQDEIGAKLDQQRRAIDQSTEEITDLSVAHASFQLQMRRLELKKNRIAEDDQKLAQMRAQEELMADALDKAREERDAANNARAELEARLRTRKMLDQASSVLPENQKEKFELVKAEFFKLAGAEQEIALSRITAPAEALVVKNFLQPGASAAPGQLAMLLAPEQKELFWVNAFFSAEDADKILPGMKCRVVLQTADKTGIPGRIAAKFPAEARDDPADPPLPVRFKITLYAQDAEALAGLHEKPRIIVRMGE